MKIDKMSIMSISSTHPSAHQLDFLATLQQIPATKAKQSFGEMLDRVRTHHALAITSHGRCKALISTPEMWSERETRYAQDIDVMERKLARAQQAQVELERLQRHARLAIDLLTSSEDQRVAVLGRAQARVARWKALALCSEDYIERWDHLLSLPIDVLAKEMVGDCAGWGNALRQNTPFSFRPEAADVVQA